MTLEQTIAAIEPLDEKAMEQAWQHWDSIAKPLRSLGKLEETIVQIAGITGNPRVSLDRKALMIFCADNGVVEEGVTQCGQLPSGTGNGGRSLPPRGSGYFPLRHRSGAGYLYPQL